ncbi:MAG: hypothetical protein WBC55_04785, partial [Dehalococcoidia bacterium]
HVLLGLQAFHHVTDETKYPVVFIAGVFEPLLVHHYTGPSAQVSNCLHGCAYAYSCRQPVSQHQTVSLLSAQISLSLAISSLSVAGFR